MMTSEMTRQRSRTLSTIETINCSPNDGESNGGMRSKELVSGVSALIIKSTLPTVEMAAPITGQNTIDDEGSVTGSTMIADEDDADDDIVGTGSTTIADEDDANEDDVSGGCNGDASDSAGGGGIGGIGVMNIDAAVTESTSRNGGGYDGGTGIFFVGTSGFSEDSAASAADTLSP